MTDKTVKNRGGNMDSPIIQLVIDPEYVRQLAEAEINRIMQNSNHGSWWDMKRLESETCRKRDWLISNILLNPQFKLEMQSISNGCEGGRWLFKALEMKSFLDRHFHFLNRNRDGGKVSGDSLSN
jgi:phage pi2 protein 07